MNRTYSGARLVIKRNTTVIRRTQDLLGCRDRVFAADSAGQDQLFRKQPFAGQFHIAESDHYVCVVDIAERAELAGHCIPENRVVNYRASAEFKLASKSGKDRRKIFKRGSKYLGIIDVCRLDQHREAGFPCGVLE